MYNHFILKKVGGYENIALFIVFLFSSYIVLYNLGYVALWHDEGVNAIIARNFLTVGEYSGWDGRNLFVGKNGVAINSDFFLASFPPWPPLPSALGLWLFGEGEVSLRFFHGVLGVLSSLLFWLLLRLDFADRKRLQVLAFTFFALSAQVLLFMRQGRYYADAFFFSLAAFYFYRLYWQRQHLRWLLGVIIMTVINFLNHFGVGASFALAMATWHIIYYGRQTSRRQWLCFIVAGMIVALISISYLWWAGIIGSDEQLEYSSDIYQKNWLARRFYLLYYHARDVMSLDWLPWGVALWWGWYVADGARWFKSSPKKHSKIKQALSKQKPVHNEADYRFATMALLVLFFTAMVSVQPVVTQKIVDSRYMIAAFPFLAVMIAVFVDWCWQKAGSWVALSVVFLILMSNSLSFPHIQPSLVSQQKIRWTLPNLLAEIHQPYESAATEVADYLRQNANKDDTLYAEPWYDNALLHYYLSDYLIFCCQLDNNATLPKNRIRQLDLPLYRSDTLPKWQVVFGGNAPSIAPNRYQAVYQTNAFYYPTQRPELEYHSFDAIIGRGGAIIFRLL